MRAAAMHNKPSNRPESSPISSPDSFILTVPHPLPLHLNAAKDMQPRGARAHGAWVKAQAPSRNQPAAAGRPATHLPPKMAPNCPSFLIDNPELEIELTHTKQKPAHISNRQFFALLKLPDTLPRRSLRAPLASCKVMRATSNRRRAACPLVLRLARLGGKEGPRRASGRQAAHRRCLSLFMSFLNSNRVSMGN